ncbi:MAG TPA: DUF1801 domain-containing protein [Caulobacter sp.]|nr:DUF1801 domain-containing protein [Caulobacter sp.]
MVQSSAATVDAFMTEVGEDRRPYIEKMRELFRTHLTGWEERMEYGMPAYGPAGDPKVGVAFNNQKQHIAFYAGETAIEKFKDQLAVPSVDCGKGCIRYKNPRKIDFEVVEAILKDIRAREGSAC